eukprot:TRINITY_DN22544_c0_g1_i1.p1 TRINITY_DN22544_c0_g1~~TRINITY_DN22544_c0_g1_i1.p1  ORF type:complete len:188 (+),score=38.23 TRINITY_DN22544_c0_g1_i1:39-566(+)
MVSRSACLEATIEDLLLDIQKGDPERVKELMDANGLGLMWRDEVGACGRTALQVACSFNNVYVVDLLIKYGWSVHNTDCRERAPLHYAALNGCTDVAHLLLSQGASFKCQDKWGQTPLHLSSQYGYTTMCQMLLDAGSDGRKKDATGLTPLEVAATPAVREFIQESMKSMKSINR